MCTEQPTRRASAQRRGERRVDPRRTLGRLGEDLAAAHFTRLGFTMLARNVHTRSGEIDLIVFDRGVLVFVEVKTRSAGFRGRRVRPEQEPLPWLRPRQRARLRRLALAWLSDERRQRPSAHTIRFDAVGVIVDGRGELLRLDHVEAAW
ncbi:MAG TPA: YraN family protein [Solirubrobacteraceae bacterium]|jgi:putative endonuclease|nr:YraN family protein [Solirubrobacteraceae bacterium]